MYAFLAEGFEEIEATTTIDFLRRSGVSVHMVGLPGGIVKGAHGIEVVAEAAPGGFTLPNDADMVFLPGGGPGTQNLQKSEMVARALHEADKRGLYIAAICAAPTVLHSHGLLKGKTVTAFPSTQAALTGSHVTGGAVEVDGRIITGRSAGVALAFAHTLAALLAGRQKADEVLRNLYPSTGQER